MESILNQTYGDFELIAVDDCSTDATGIIPDDFSKIDRRAKVIVNSVNHGLTESLNKALALTDGTYTARMDGDDVAD